MTSCNSLRDTSVKRSSNSNTHKQRRLLCILSQHCSWKQIPHLSPPPPITVISPICLGQWQASWSCSLYSFSYKSLLIVSLQGCCASPVLGLWQCADLGLSSHHVSVAGPGGRISNQELKKNPQQRAAPANHGLLKANMLKVNQRSPNLFLLEPSLTEVLSRQVIITISTSTTGQMTLEPGPIVLTWSSFIPLKRSFFTLTPCLMPFSLLSCLVVKLTSL